LTGRAVPANRSNGPVDGKDHPKIVRIRTFLIVEILNFGAAALMHVGLMPFGKEDSGAATAESVIAVVLLAGLLLGLARPALAPAAGLAVQVFALLGTCVGATLVIIGVGPRTAIDVVVHIIMLAVLIWGVVVAMRPPAKDVAARA
jgi:hypothetical protein